MRIVMLEPLGIAEEAVMKLAQPLIEKGHEFAFCGSKIQSEKEAAAKAADADILIISNSPLSAKVINAAEKLKMISVAFTGVDHVDSAACIEKGVLVANAQGYCTSAVAELAIGLILSTLRNIVPCNEGTRQGKTKDGLVGNELYGKTVGIIGTGAIGARVGELVKVFGCKLLGYDKYESEYARNIGIKYVELEELLSKSDIVTIHAPLTDETRLLINKERLSLMKPTSILINAARGPIVDSKALADALNEGRIAGAGIDVFEAEPPVETTHPLFNAKNTIVTPHIGFATKESIYRRAEITFDNITAWMNGERKNVKIG